MNKLSNCLSDGKYPNYKNHFIIKKHARYPCDNYNEKEIGYAVLEPLEWYERWFSTHNFIKDASPFDSHATDKLFGTIESASYYIKKWNKNPKIKIIHDEV